MTEKNKGGRPTKYEGDKTVEKAMKYAKEDFMLDGLGSIFPTEYGLALYLGVSTSTIDNWEENHAEFLGVLEYIKAMQGVMLINKGLTGEYNSTIAKLLMSSRLGINETSIKDVNGKVSIKDFLDG